MQDGWECSGRTSPEKRQLSLRETKSQTGEETGSPTEI